MQAETENYLFLGKIARCFFFHRIAYVQRDEDLVVRMCCDVYNALINERIIQRGDNLVVYNTTVGDPPQVQPVHIWHSTFSEIFFPEGALDHAFARLLAVRRPPSQERLVVVAVFEGAEPAKYEVYEIPGIAGPPPGLPTLPKTGPLLKGMSIKPIPYLGDGAN